MSDLLSSTKDISNINDRNNSIERRSNGDRFSDTKTALRFYEQYIKENESTENKKLKGYDTITIAIRCIGTKVNHEAQFKGY